MSRAHTDIAHGNGPKLFCFRRMVNYSAVCAGARMELHGTRRAAHGMRAHAWSARAAAWAVRGSRKISSLWFGAVGNFPRGGGRGVLRAPSARLRF